MISKCHIRKLKEVLKFHGVKFRFSPNQGSSFAHANKGFVIIGLKYKTKESLTSVVFHELAHVLLYLEGKYLPYHDLSQPLTKSLARKIVRIGVRAERHADRRAREEMAKYFPEMTYIPAYATKCEVDEYKKKMINYHRKVYSESI